MRKPNDVKRLNPKGRRAQRAELEARHRVNGEPVAYDAIGGQRIRVDREFRPGMWGRSRTRVEEGREGL